MWVVYSLSLARSPFLDGGFGLEEVEEGLFCNGSMCGRLSGG